MITERIHYHLRPEAVAAAKRLAAQQGLRSASKAVERLLLGQRSVRKTFSERFGGTVKLKTKNLDPRAQYLQTKHQ